MNASFFRQIADSPWFNHFILWVILAAGVLVGIETYHQEDSPWRGTLEGLDLLILLIFTAEFAIKILAEGERPWNYFRDPWNVFDFSVVAVCWLAHVVPSMNAGFVAVIRLARVLRVLRLVHALPQLKMLVNAMLKSIPSMGYVGILLLLLYYIYGAMGVFMFGKNDPLHFGSLGTAMLSLFRISTLEGWTEIMYVNMFGCDDPKWGYGPESGCLTPQPHGTAAVLYFVTFVLVGTMIVLNLFIGVIMNAMDEVRAEHELEERHARKSGGIAHLEDELAELHTQLDSMKKQLDYIAFRLKK
ncbi:MAG: ion transporter [Haliscomenobacteraceae bacterium CHB4]|nr:ion transporter [Haliscomenobacteraceae bacterium CHB4]